MSAIYGPKCFELFARLNRNGSSLRTFAAYLRSNLERYTPKLSHRWNALIMRSRHFVFRLAPLKDRTGEIDCGLWQEEKAPRLLPTPTTHETRHPEIMLRNNRRICKNGATYTLNLTDTLALLPTPQARDYRSPDRPGSANFDRKVRNGWTIDLNSRIGLQGDGYKYSPAFGEWLMGYPINWTSLTTDELIFLDFRTPWIEVADKTCTISPTLGTDDNRDARIKTIGNTIVPLIALEIFRAIEDTEQSERSEDSIKNNEAKER